MKDIAYELEKIGQASRLHKAQGVLNRLEDEFVLVKEALEKKNLGNINFPPLPSVLIIPPPLNLPPFMNPLFARETGLLRVRRYRLALF